MQWFAFVWLGLGYWTPWLKLPGPCMWLLVLTFASLFILSFAWDLQESKGRHVPAPYSLLSLHGQTYPAVLRLRTAPFSPLLLSFPCTHKKGLSDHKQSQQQRCQTSAVISVLLWKQFFKAICIKVTVLKAKRFVILFQEAATRHRLGNKPCALW